MNIQEFYNNIEKRLPIKREGSIEHSDYLDILKAYLKEYDESLDHLEFPKDWHIDINRINSIQSIIKSPFLFLFSVEKLFLSLHPQAPQQSVANEKETSNPGVKTRNLCLFKEWKISKRYCPHSWIQ